MVLLVQFRTDKSGPHEVKCFYDALGILYSDLHIVNALDPSLSSNDLQEYVDSADAVILGGSGETSFHSDDPKSRQKSDKMRAKMRSVVRGMLKSKKPLLGVCFGFQLMADALDVPVEPDLSQAETGIVDVTIADEARSDPLFEGMSHVFSAVVAHKESVLNVPKSAELLASSKHCENQVVKFGVQQYGLIFHPELDQKELQFRLNLYPEYKKNKGGSIKKTMTTDSNDIPTHRILKNFLKIANINR